MTAAVTTKANSTATTDTTTHSRPIPLLDQLAQALARLTPSRFGVTSAGAFWEYGPGSTSWWDAWREPSAFTVRLGRVEVQIDLKKPTAEQEPRRELRDVKSLA